MKRKFVQRKAMHKIKAEEAERIDGAALAARARSAARRAVHASSRSRATSSRWQKDEAANARSARARAAVRGVGGASARRAASKHRRGVLFKAPHKLDPQHLVPRRRPTQRRLFRATVCRTRTAPARGLRADRSGTDLAGALDEANYCIWCHEQGKDSCSKGLREKGATGPRAKRRSRRARSA